MSTEMQIFISNLNGLIIRYMGQADWWARQAGQLRVERDKAQDTSDFWCKTAGTVVQERNEALALVAKLEAQLAVRTEQRCPRCGNLLRRAAVQSNGTHFCDNCRRWVTP